ncbi:hypothetical protein BN59_03093 [Legionella massiliensis]|uniref:Uncharacterized protein n=1 Tax=Legionella massiliensis TaxID=1034943 RepID=A0A078L3S4_9GAMM|nr:outer membrane beta-barrel protein [Legionella massiliensis]CDZ78779.1 hypothetical protein BN59_03093 [Legionella massiliensis]CEE14517.1 hypothetical protein BN1094_03093 [Legionella massiliensis]
MKYSSQFAIAGLMLASCSTFAVTPADGWYLGLMGGLSFAPSINLRTPNPTQLLNIAAATNPTSNNLNINPLVTLPNSKFPGWYSFLNGTVEHSVGGDFGGQVGYRICNFRVEGQFLFNYSPVSSIKVGGTTITRHVTFVNPLRVSGQTALGAGLVNGYYDFYNEDNDPTWVPYLGLGIGYSYIRNTVTTSVPYLFNSGYNFTVKTNKSTPIGQGIIGISYYYSDTLAFGMDYRYISTRNIKELGSRISSNTLNFNFNYWFGQ